VLRLVALGRARPRDLTGVLAIGLRPARAVEAEDGIHLVYGRGDRSLQLRLRGECGPGPESLMAEFPADPRGTGAWLNALARFSRLQASGRIDERVPLDPRGPRLCTILRALDGALAGMSQREIAALLVGPERVEADWRHPGQNLRDRVRRAVRRGHALMNGGYLALLR
jgi:hypothetical protein